MNKHFLNKIKIIEAHFYLNFSLLVFQKPNDKKGKLSHLTFAIKDNFNYYNTITTGGSKFLQDYVAPYNATVIELLLENGAHPVCKTNLDEFGLGGTGLFSGYGDVINPIDFKRIPGGSSSGSAVAVKIDGCDFALGTDTGDSIRRPASYLGIIGYKPTYGLISRYGVLPYSPSLDHVGLLTKKMETIFTLMQIIAKNDPKDFTSQNVLLNFETKFEFSNFNVAVVEETWIDINPKIKKAFYNKLSLVKKLKIKSASYNARILDLIPLTYNILSYSEAVSCYQNMSTITFGPKTQGTDFTSSVIEARSQLFGSELKRRFLIGAYCTSDENYEKLFLKSAKVRTKIIEEFNQILQNCDLVISLGSSTVAPLKTEIKSGQYQDKYADYFLQVANFGGFPSITIPFIEHDGLPIGINISGKVNDDLKVLSCAEYIIEILGKE